MTPELATALDAALADLRQRPWGGELPVTEFSEFLHADPTRVHRGAPEHFTASSMIFTPDLSHTLLCFHGKGEMWVQLGGHMEEGDLSPASGALREAQEESGLSGFSLLSPAPIELHRHGLAATFGDCHAHWDVVYALQNEHAPPVVSEESKAVQWFPVDALPQGCAPGFEEQFTQVLHRVRTVV